MPADRSPCPASSHSHAASARPSYDRARSGVRRVDRHHVLDGVFQHVEGSTPVNRRRFHRDASRALGHEPGAQLKQVGRRGGEGPQLLPAFGYARHRCVRTYATRLLLPMSSAATRKCGSSIFPLQRPAANSEYRVCPEGRPKGRNVMHALVAAATHHGPAPLDTTSSTKTSKTYRRHQAGTDLQPSAHRPTRRPGSSPKSQLPDVVERPR